MMKNVFKLTLMAIMMVACSTAVQAKDDDNSKKQHMTREQMAEAQAKHIAHDLALDDATSQKFIETFTAYQKDVWAFGPKGKIKDKDKRKNLTEAEAEKVIKEQFDHSQKILSIRQDYYKKYCKFLTQKQILRVYEMEKKAMGRLMKHGRDGKHDRDGKYKVRPGKKPGTKEDRKPGDYRK